MEGVSFLPLVFLKKNIRPAVGGITCCFPFWLSKVQSQMKECLAALSTLVAKVEEDLDNAQKDVTISEVMNTMLRRDVHEVRSS